MINYLAVSNVNQGSFNNPRQKTWSVMQNGEYGWYITLITGDFEEAKTLAGNIIKGGGQYINVNAVMVQEIVPIDLIMTPSV